MGGELERARRSLLNWSPNVDLAARVPLALCLWMADLSVLKGELKAWEKAFKAANGREARKEDIKLDGAIGELELTSAPPFSARARGRVPPLA